MAWNSTKAERSSFSVPWKLLENWKWLGVRIWGRCHLLKTKRQCQEGSMFFASTVVWLLCRFFKGNRLQDRPFSFMSLGIVWKAEECGHPELKSDCHLGVCSLNMIGLRWLSFCAGTSMDMPQYQPGPSSHNMEHLPSHIVLPSTIGSVIHTISVCRYPVSQCFN